MPCISVFAFSRPCSNVLGGIRAVYVANPDNVGVAIYPAAGTATLIGKGGVAKPFFRWDVADNSSSLESTPQINEANDSAYYQHVLSAVLPGFNPTVAGANILTRLPRAVFVVEYHDGTRDLLAVVNDDLLNEGASVALALASGTNRGDRRGATVTATLNSAYLPFRVDGNFDNLVNS